MTCLTRPAVKVDVSNGKYPKDLTIDADDQDEQRPVDTPPTPKTGKQPARTSKRSQVYDENAGESSSKKSRVAEDDGGEFETRRKVLIDCHTKISRVQLI
ncbi:hypothetical protein LTR10_007983 [Elasticomyces elasticus]|nr:hypothetical protein LTR10_007983 [Elasticomyces elasticus]KAK4970982.1 hypothetical protein LTR42_007959 [Elasticomyces elasticus]